MTPTEKKYAKLIRLKSLPTITVSPFSSQFDFEVYDRELIDKIKSVVSGHEFSVTTPGYKVKVSIGEKSIRDSHGIPKAWVSTGNLNVKLRAFDRIFVDKNGHAYPYKQACELELFITPENMAYCKIGKDKKARWVPLIFKKFVPYLECEQIQDMLPILFAGNAHFIKDVLHDLLESSTSFQCPITIADAQTFHNRDEFFKTKYVRAKELKWNYNKHNINNSYFVIKCLNHVDPRDIGILQNLDDSLINEIWNANKSCYFSQRGYAAELAYTIYTKKYLAGMTEKEQQTARENGKYCDVQDVIKDYVQMCVQTRTPVRLGYSVKRIMDEHDHFTERYDKKYYNRVVKAFKIPKGTKFAELNTLLPEGFEWIKTKKRLIEETLMMHHCVWSYGDKIADDNCAIYSYFDSTGEFDETGNKEPKRYTIEFIKSGKKYKIRQIQTRCDRGGGSLLYRYLNNLLNPKPKKEAA